MISDRSFREARVWSYEHPRDSLSRLGVPLVKVLIGPYFPHLRLGEIVDEWTIIAENCREVR
jgi:hypothetical protein